MLIRNSQFTLYAIFGLAYYYGSVVVNHSYCNFPEFMKALMALLFGAMIAGQVSSSGPDVQKARGAAKRLYRIIKSHEVRGWARSNLI